MPAAFTRGQVILAPVLDPQGRNLKHRPCVVIACSDTRVAVVPITSSLLDDIAPADRIDLPHSNDPAHPCHTGLRKKSAADCAWQTVIGVEEVDGLIGHIDPADVRRIVLRVGQLVAEREATQDPPRKLEGAEGTNP